ncbi:MAG: 2,3-bisphosphoglycerate-independent phosphoglycerate mutase, partial [Pyrinomonadaceae bacterium]
MQDQIQKIKRPVALVILDGWGYAPRTEGNAIAAAHTPYYDEICRNFPMTTLSASGPAVGQLEDQPGSAEVGHLNIGTGRVAQTETSKIKRAIASGEVMQNQVLCEAFSKAKDTGSSVHLIGLLSDGGVHSSTESLFALLRLAKQHQLSDVNIHCILDGVDVPPRTADIYIEALEIKLADIGIGRIATMCGRFFGMDSGEKWERTARYFTMLVHAEGEPAKDAVTAVRNSFLRGISDEFIAPIVIEAGHEVPVTRVKSSDLVIFFNHRADAMRQLVRSVCVPEGESGAKPVVETVCLTEYDAAYGLPTAFRPDPEQNTLTSMLDSADIPVYKITESARFPHLTQFFDGGADTRPASDQDVLVSGGNANGAYIQPESQSFKIVDRVRRGVETSPNG